MANVLRLFVLLVCYVFGSVAAADSGSNAAVYYEIFVRSFQDSDGDGIGDLQGVIERLDYLDELGVSGIWLMPIHPSPSYHGYDVTDYYAVHPDYGTLQDFKTLLAEAHARGIDVIIDLVVNHTSREHPWFKAARAGDLRYRDYYLWSDTDPGWRGTGGAPAWHRNGEAYYLGLFWSGMPDLNYRNPEVTRVMKEIATFWLELGVDGFRIDAIQHIIESEDGRIRNTQANLAWVRDFASFVESVDPQALIVGETWTDTDTIVSYHREAGLDMSFNYPLFEVLTAAVQKRAPTTLAFVLEQDERLYPMGARRGSFISNHDQVRPATSLGLLRRDEKHLKFAAGLLMTLPGTPFLYYGDEIGLPNGGGSRDEEKRTPMRWDDGTYAGFSTAEPWYPFSTSDASISVAVQRQQPDSLLNWYKQMIALRHAHPALQWGTLEVLEHDNRSLLAVTREGDGEMLVILANFSARAANVDLEAFSFDVPFRVLVGAPAQGNVLPLPPLGITVLQFPLD